jgi:hypothetical protein
LNSIFAAFLKGSKGKTKGKGMEAKGGKGKKGRDPTPTPSAKGSDKGGKSRNKGKGIGKDRNESCFYWIKYGNCSRGASCGFNHEMALKASNPNAVFPEAKASAAVLADPGSSWVAALFEDQQYYSSLRNPADSSTLTAATFESSQSGIVTRNMRKNVIHACVSTSIPNPIKLSNRFAVLNRTVSFRNSVTAYPVEKTGYAKIYKSQTVIN